MWFRRCKIETIYVYILEFPVFFVSSCYIQKWKKCREIDFSGFLVKPDLDILAKGDEIENYPIRSSRSKEGTFYYY